MAAEQWIRRVKNPGRTVRRVAAMPARLARTQDELRRARAEIRKSEADLRAARKQARGQLAEVRSELARVRAELAQAKTAGRRRSAELKRVQRELRVTRELYESGSELPERVTDAMRAVRRGGLTYLEVASLGDLAAAVLELEERGAEGLLVEAGTARGGSAIVMAAAKAPDRPMRVYDVFGMIPPPSEVDGPDVAARYRTIASGKAKGPEGSDYYGYEADLLGQVRKSFAAAGLAVEDNAVELIQGLFEDTIEIAGPVALAHLDGDWYASTMICLERIVPHLIPGGRLVIDDYEWWSGCRTAVDEYFADRTGFRFEHKSRLHVVRE